MQSINDDHNFYAILGPTNTGKTYYAFERLLSYNSGIFGFPLRLLARENYDKAINTDKLYVEIKLDDNTMIKLDKNIIEREDIFFKDKFI